MALNLDLMKQKMASLTGKGDSKKNNFWRPQEGENNIRIVPTADGDPFKEKFFHYGVGEQSFLCPKRNFGDACPVCDFANQLWNENTEESKQLAKGMFAKQRFFSPVLVRGEESEGVKVWGYGKLAYQKLLGIVLDPDYGDITDPEDGNDLKLMYGKQPGASYPTTDIRPRPRKSVLCDDAVGGDERCAELLETVPNFETIFERKTTEEVRAILDGHMSGETTTDREIVRGGSNSSPVKQQQDAVSAAFDELLQ
tara:strand:- start:258 stop:1019 length:762 start_codon:yes stop_codon:yes gene_type:complete